MRVFTNSLENLFEGIVLKFWRNSSFKKWKLCYLCHSSKCYSFAFSRRKKFIQVSNNLRGVNDERTTPLRFLLIYMTFHRKV